MAAKSRAVWEWKIVRRALWDSIVKLNPKRMMGNPVMFVVEAGSVITTVLLLREAMHGHPGFKFNLQITLWLWFTVLFANFAEAMAEGRGKAQADTLRKARAETQAHRLRADGSLDVVPSSKLRSGDVVVVSAGEFIPGDGEVIEGVASVDESAITGESAPVIRESGGDRSAVTGGTRVLSDQIRVRITSNPGETFLDRMIKLVEGASRQKTPNEIALNILLAGLTIIFLLAVITLQPLAIYSGAPQSIFVLVSLLVCLIPTTIGGLMSGVVLGGLQVRKGAPEAILKHVAERGQDVPEETQQCGADISNGGGTPVLVAENARILGVVALTDIVKGGMRERFEHLRAMGIRTMMITGDNPLTAAAIARQAGVDDFLAEARPEDKMALIKREQAKGKLVAMTGDGTNDAPALAQADVGVAMNTGTQAAKEAGNMVDLDSNPTKLIEIVEIGKQLLMTRGSLTTFSIANDVAKYFAIIPAMFAGTFPVLNALNIMHLQTPGSAILSAVIFNALIIIALIPLALRGVKYRPMAAAALLRNNLWIYGAGGIIVPFIGIKLIDMLITRVGLA